MSNGENYRDVLSAAKGRRWIVILGAGNYGQRVCSRLREDGIRSVVFADNSVAKQGTEIKECAVYSPEECARIHPDALWIIPMSTVRSGHEKEFYQQIKQTVSQENIHFVIVDSIYSNTDAEGYRITLEYLREAIKLGQVCKRKMKEISEIKSLVFREKPSTDIANGPVGVLLTQKKLMGDQWNGLKLSYSFKEDNDISTSTTYRLNEWIGAVEFARRIAKQSDSTIYIAHDIFSAAGLATTGEHYVLIYHQQGEIIYESRNFGNVYPEEIEDAVKDLELFAVANADYVAFPSEGAEYFFRKSGRFKSFPDYASYGALYNTLNEDLLKQKKEIGGLYKDQTKLTICSIGQMTEAKGIDQIPTFLNALSGYIEKPIRWIVVADGILKEKVVQDMQKLQEENTKLSFVQYDRLSHDEINYLLGISDAYCMLHRVSIFDIATLEAMYNNLLLVLSDIPGNIEYNKEENLFLVPDLSECDFGNLKDYLLNPSVNRKVFEDYFSESKFKKRYSALFEALCGKAKVNGS